MSMTNNVRPMIPALSGIYSQAEQWAYLLLRWLPERC